MKVAVGCDHAGLELKKEVSKLLQKRGFEIDDVGTFGNDSVDYPDFASQVSRKVGSGEVRFGVLVCGTGLGMSIVANKYRGVRAAVCTSEFEARATRAHNDANVLCLGERVVGIGLGAAIAEAFFDTEFEGGRHQRRVQKISDAEDENAR
ncbi:ribose 5-phosphate isomerase B [Vulgatibacter incomptus]|uniref:Ribose 5-phosphate isomerase B n=1 Tax=Vulgatibacter incomptus TaxID=1391653 RepID=A0A0K1PCW6_9BACT|nr:ribose 5-phosphate isomerase B [Vulgatibacter incomptus]AKU91241.1 Ribose 5-phosphate isomerase B [Vulgatibacter incomptus]